MGKINFQRIARAIPHLSTQQLAEVVSQCHSIAEARNEVLVPSGKQKAIVAARNREVSRSELHHMVTTTQQVLMTIDTLHFVELAMHEIATIAMHARGQLLKDGLEGKAGTLAKAFIDYGIASERFQPEPDPELMAHFHWLDKSIKEHIKGIRLALNENDGGEYLRVFIASENEALSHFKAMRDALNTGGRPSRMSSYRQIISRAGRALKMEHSDWSWTQVANRIIYDLKNMATLTGAEREALAKLEASRNRGRMVADAMRENK